jgi:hypothetical protein
MTFATAQTTIAQLSSGAELTFTQRGGLWVAPLFLFLERQQHGLGAAWAFECVRQVLANDSQWRKTLEQLLMYLEDDLYPHSFYEMARAIWYQPGHIGSERNAVARLYWAIGFQRDGSLAAPANFMSAIEVIVGSPGEDEQRFATAIALFEQLGQQALSEQGVDQEHITL